MSIPTRRLFDFALLGAVVALAGCGGTGGPTLSHDDAAPLIALSHTISHEGPCAQARDIPRLQRRTEALVNARHVPAALAESLMSGVNALTVEAPLCMPAVPVTTDATPPPEPAPPGHAKVKHHHDHGKHGGEGD